MRRLKLLPLYQFVLLPILCLTMVATFVSCSGDDEPSSDSSNTVYSVTDSSNFPPNLIVTSIVKERTIIRGGNKNAGTYTNTTTYAFAYDSLNLISNWTRVETSATGFTYTDEVIYNWEDGSCTLSMYGEKQKYAFSNNLLVSSKVTYDGCHLTKGVNHYTLTWNSEGNITSYSDGNQMFTYTDYENIANFDFNLLLHPCLLEDAWDDDDSKYFGYFGWTGVRTTNMIGYITYGEDCYSISYTTDSGGRIIEIDSECLQNDSDFVEYYHYDITYMED